MSEQPPGPASPAPDDDAARPESTFNAATGDPPVPPGISDSAGPGAAAEPNGIPVPGTPAPAIRLGPTIRRL